MPKRQHPKGLADQTPLFDYQKCVAEFMEISYINDDHGYIVWRIGTGGNTELLHLKTFPTLQGHGKRLFKMMLHSLLQNPPYSTVYGFCLASNQVAKKFYESVGFDLTFVQGVYAEGGAYIFSQTFDKLKEIHSVQSTQRTSA